MSITENKDRIAAFTSSNIYKLMSNSKSGGIGKPGMTYIEEKQIEKRLNRSIEVESHSQAMAWGIFLESYVFSLIGMEYVITSKSTDVHPSIKGWSGSKDLVVEGVKVSDIKCYQPKNFAKYTDALLTESTEVLKKDFPKEYWQLVSNAIINDCPKGEAITFMPYEQELDEIRAMVEAYEGGDIWKYRFIVENEKAALPYLPAGGYYKNLNKFEFEIPQSDIIELTDRVLLALTYLND